MPLAMQIGDVAYSKRQYSVDHCKSATALTLYCSFFTLGEKFSAGKNLVTVQTQLRFYSEQRAFGIY